MSPKPESCDSIHQLRIVLEGIELPVWRRVEVPSSIDLGELHAVIQAVMGWSDYHLHEFEIGEDTYGSADDEEDDVDEEVDDESLVTLDEVAPVKSSFTYVYDFGDDWRHRIEVEDVEPAEQGVRYPRLLDGQRSCPSEDSGGVSGYKALLRSRHKGDFDPERFDPVEAGERLARSR